VTEGEGKATNGKDEAVYLWRWATGYERLL